MKSTQRASQKEPARGLLARPLDALVFLLPLILFYEAASLAHPERVIAFDIMRRFFELFGQVGMWAPGLAVIVILLATHAASDQAWSVHFGRVGLMYLEAVALAIPLLALNWAIPLQASEVAGASLIDKLAMGVGAGVYEELVFRLIFISLGVMIGVDLLRLNRAKVALVVILLSSLLFAAHHHAPIGMEPFDLQSTAFLASFTFRFLAGCYLAAVFWYRGYGPAAGCHACYNVGLVVVETLMA